MGYVFLNFMETQIAFMHYGKRLYLNLFPWIEIRIPQQLKRLF